MIHRPISIGGRRILSEQGKKDKIVESAVLGNIGHIIIVLITGRIMRFLDQFNALSMYHGSKIVFLAIIFILTLFFWFLIGMRSTKNQRDHLWVHGIATAVIAILPILFFTILSNIFSYSIENAEALTRWNRFYLVGGPTLFWHRPFSLVSEILVEHYATTSSYLVFYLNILFVGLALYFGSVFFGRSAKRR